MAEGVFPIYLHAADAARRWYQSDDYQEALKVRLSTSHGRVFLIEGTEISTAVSVAHFGPRERLNLFRRQRKPVFVAWLRSDRRCSHEVDCRCGEAEQRE